MLFAQRYWRLLVALLAAPLIALFFDVVPVDAAITQGFYDANLRGFPLRDDAFMQNVLHNGAKLVVVMIALGVLGAFLLSFLIPQWTHHRRRLLWTFAGMAGGALAVSLLKHNSTLHCPWDLIQYGGYAPLQGLFDRLPQNVAAGRCFPGGHASGGFALMAFYFGWDDIRPRAARAGLALGLFAGMLMGWVQVMRGAHFLSHNVWSAWVVWTFLALLYHLLPPGGASGTTRQHSV